MVGHRSAPEGCCVNEGLLPKMLLHWFCVPVDGEIKSKVASAFVILGYRDGLCIGCHLQ